MGCVHLLMKTSWRAPSFVPRGGWGVTVASGDPSQMIPSMKKVAGRVVSLSTQANAPRTPPS
jgi:hypothetical protein